MTMVAGQQKIVNTKEKEGGALVPAGQPKQPVRAKRK